MVYHLECPYISIYSVLIKECLLPPLPTLLVIPEYEEKKNQRGVLLWRHA